MIKYEKQILSLLLDKYESSKSFIGTNRVNQSFTCKVAQMFPKYKDDSEYEFFCAINEAVDTLAVQGFVTAKRLKNGVLQSVTLNLETIDKAYEYLGRIPKSDIVIDLKKYCFFTKIAIIFYQLIALASWSASQKINR